MGGGSGSEEEPFIAHNSIVNLQFVENAMEKYHLL